MSSLLGPRVLGPELRESPQCPRTPPHRLPARGIGCKCRPDEAVMTHPFHACVRIHEQYVVEFAGCPRFGCNQVQLAELLHATAPGIDRSLAHEARFGCEGGGIFDGHHGVVGERAQRQKSVCPAGCPLEAASTACITIGSVRGIVMNPSFRLRCQSHASGVLGKWTSSSCCARSAIFIRLAVACFPFATLLSSK